MDYTSIFVSVIIIASAALYNVYKSEPRIQRQEQTVTHMTEQITELQDQIKEMSSKYDNDKLKSKQKEESTRNDIRKIQSKIDEKGVTYVRWGKTVCSGDNTETVYKGQVCGGHYSHKGASVNYICLPKDPEFAKPLQKRGDYAFLYGAQYQLYDSNKPEGIRSGVEDHDVACAVCIAKGKTTKLMIPGRQSCYKGWKMEYNGYLMAGYHDHPAATEYACVDRDTEVIPGGANNEDGKLFYPVKTQCGSLKCPPYKQATEVLCVVCTK